jgi:hypothetical protein
MSKNKENSIQNTDIQKCQYFLTLILITTGLKTLCGNGFAINILSLTRQIPKTIKIQQDKQQKDDMVEKK